jgi:hypothetical protein
MRERFFSKSWLSMGVVDLYLVEVYPGINVPTFVPGGDTPPYKCGHIYTGVSLHPV